MSYCINSRPWILKEAFSEGYAIYKPLGTLGFKSFDISRLLTNWSIENITVKTRLGVKK